jgi:hypothetical protein
MAVQCGPGHGKDGENLVFLLGRQARWLATQLGVLRPFQLGTHSDRWNLTPRYCRRSRAGF